MTLSINDGIVTINKKPINGSSVSEKAVFKSVYDTY